MKASQATITSKGQVTIPSIIREKLHLVSGNKLEFIIKGGSFIAIPVNKSVGKLKGILPKPSKSLSLDEINRVISDSYDRH